MGEYSWQEVSSVPSLVSYFWVHFSLSKYVYFLEEIFWNWSLLSPCYQTVLNSAHFSWKILGCEWNVLLHFLSLSFFFLLVQIMLFLGKKKWRPSQISQSINSPTRVALMCSSSHHLTWNAIPRNLSNQRPAWDPPCWSRKLPWTGKSRVHFTELLCLPAPSSFLFRHGVETSGAVRGWLVTYRLVTPTSSISEVLGQWTRWRDYGVLFFPLSL